MGRLPSSLGFMRPRHFIAPAIALAVAGMLLGKQRKGVERMAEESAALRGAIAVALGGDDGSRSSSKRPVARDGLADDGGRPDWKRIALYFSESKNNGGDPGWQITLQKQLLAMDAGELMVALDEIAAMGLDEETKMELEGKIFGPLAEKDPELAFNRFKGYVGKHSANMAWQLQSAFGDWAVKDSVAAVAWLDREVSAGTFQGKSLKPNDSLRIRYETKAVSGLLGSDPALAGSRLAAMAPGMRRSVLGGVNLKEGSQAVHAELVRGLLDETERREVFGGMASSIARAGDFGKVDGYFGRISATAEERERMVADASLGYLGGKVSGIGRFTAANIDEVREWVAKGSPGAVGRITGKALAEAMDQRQPMGFSEASELVLRYRDAAGNDDTLVSFLDNAGEKISGDEARGLAEKVSDPKQRERLLGNIK